MKKGSKCKRMFTLLINSFKCDYIIFNWLESIPFFTFGTLQFILATISLKVLKVRKVKILFMFHDLVPHFGDNWMSKFLMRWLFENSDLIITHSKEALEIARIKTVLPSYYVCHPVHITKEDFMKTTSKVDVFIWGAIYDYKGIYEFISHPSIQTSSLNIYILGCCKDSNLRDKILSMSNSHIKFENRRADFPEIAAYCKNSKFVLFPYVGESISSSGALIDTLVFGGNPIGPNRGAFKDLSEEKVCLVYDNYDELYNILCGSQTIMSQDRNNFTNKYSWTNFAKFIYEKLN